MLANSATFGSLWKAEERFVLNRPSEQKLARFFVLACRGQAFGLQPLRIEILMCRQEAFEITKRIIGNGHLAEMIFPHISLDRAPRKRLSVNGDHLAFSIHT